MMKTKYRGMTLAAMLLSASTVAAGEQNDVAYDGDGYVTPVAYVGDVSAAAEDAYFAEDAGYAMRASDEAESDQATAVQSVSHAEQKAPQIANVRQPARRQYAPVSASQLQPVGYDMGGYDTSVYAAAPSAYCDGGCDDGSCDSLGGKSCGLGGLSDLLGCSGSSGWARTEFLMWFVQERQSPSLVVTAPAGDTDFANAANAYGDPLESDLSVGFRGDYGMYLSDDIGIGGRFWIIDETSDSFAAADNGDNLSLGRPYFNTDTGANDILINAFNGVINGQAALVQGGVEAESSLDLLAAEAYARIKFASSACCQLDLIGGYSYFQVDDSLAMRSISSINPNIFELRDNIDTENRFNGGQIGFDSRIKKGRWTSSMLAKVHLGNMNQSLRQSGFRSNTIVGGPVTTADAGFYVGEGESGERERDEFTFAPELNFHLGYSFRNHVEFTVGYTFIYFDNVALVGNHINPNINGLDLVDTNPQVNPSRTFSFNDGSLWVQGVDLGVTVTY